MRSLGLTLSTGLIAGAATLLIWLFGVSPVGSSWQPAWAVHLVQDRKHRKGRRKYDLPAIVFILSQDKDFLLRGVCHVVADSGQSGEPARVTISEFADIVAVSQMTPDLLPSILPPMWDIPLQEVMCWAR